jgi:hypothetical protein
VYCSDAWIEARIRAAGEFRRLSWDFERLPQILSCLHSLAFALLARPAAVQSLDLEVNAYRTLKKKHLDIVFYPATACAKAADTKHGIAALKIASKNRTRGNSSCAQCLHRFLCKKIIAMLICLWIRL